MKEKKQIRLSIKKPYQLSYDTENIFPLTTISNFHKLSLNYPHKHNITNIHNNNNNNSYTDLKQTIDSNRKTIYNKTKSLIHLNINNPTVNRQFKDTSNEYIEQSLLPINTIKPTNEEHINISPSNRPRHLHIKTPSSNIHHFHMNIPSSHTHTHTHSFNNKTHTLLSNNKNTYNKRISPLHKYHHHKRTSSFQNDLFITSTSIATSSSRHHLSSYNKHRMNTPIKPKRCSPIPHSCSDRSIAKTIQTLKMKAVDTLMSSENIHKKMKPMINGSNFRNYKVNKVNLRSILNDNDYYGKDISKRQDKVYMKNKNNEFVFTVLNKANAELMNFCDNYLYSNDIAVYKHRKRILNKYIQIQQNAKIKIPTPSPTNNNNNEQINNIDNDISNSKRYKNLKYNNFKIKQLTYTIMHNKRNIKNKFNI